MIGLALVAWVCAAPEPVGVLPLDGTAPATLKAKAERTLLDALGGMRGLQVVDLGQLGALFGPEAQAQLDACADDPCLRRALSNLRLSRVVLGSLDQEARLVLRLRTIHTATVTEAVTRLSRDLGEAELVSVVAAAALDLFPEHAAGSFGRLVVVTEPGAQVIVDGRAAGRIPLLATEIESALVLDLSAGRHVVRVVADRRWPQERGVDVLVGQNQRLEVSLDKNRSMAPAVLAGVGAALLAGAGVAGLLTQGTVDDWQQGCPTGANCAAGFTRARYENDSDKVDAGRWTTNGLLTAGGVALAAGAIWFLLDPGVATDSEAGVP